MARKSKASPKMSPIQVIGDVRLSAQAERVLEKGPKFAIPPRMEAVDKVALVRSIASKAPEEKVSQIINEGIDCLENLRGQAHQKFSFGSTVHELRTKGLRLCVSDKEGGFVVLDSEKYEQKATQAVAKNFIPVEEKRTKSAKKAILEIFEDNRQGSLVTKIKGTKETHLSVFFFQQKHTRTAFLFGL